LRSYATEASLTHVRRRVAIPDGDIATVTLNRPDRLNALDKAMWQRLAAIMAEIAGDDAVRCVILRGAGRFRRRCRCDRVRRERDTPAKAAPMQRSWAPP